MKDQINIAGKSKDLQALLRLKFGVKGRDLEHALKRTGRRLPRRLRARGKEIVKAEHLARNPKLARQLDGARINDAYDSLNTHLGAIDVADRRRGKMLGLAGSLVGNLLIVGVGLLFWMWWRGYF